MARNRTRGADRRERSRAATAATRFPGLRWVPVPLAALAVVIGVLLMGSFQGQVAAANAHQPPGYRAGGLSLTVGTMLWMMNMKPSGGYQMPSSMMPGLQKVGDNRLRVEVSLSNVSTSPQWYSANQFSLVAPGGKTWPLSVDTHNVQPMSGELEPGFETTIDMYFDVPAKNSKNLSLKWARGGTTVSVPVNTGGTGAGTMHM
jgi:Domain of unknown function (DUF4352)